MAELLGGHQARHDEGQQPIWVGCGEDLSEILSPDATTTMEDVSRNMCEIHGDCFAPRTMMRMRMRMCMENHVDGLSWQCQLRALREDGVLNCIVSETGSEYSSSMIVDGARRRGFVSVSEWHRKTR